MSKDTIVGRYSIIERLARVSPGETIGPCDRDYMLRPIEWYLKEPWMGRRKLSYLYEAFDCDDFDDVLRVELVKRHVKSFGGAKWGEKRPAIPIFRADVFLTTGGAHRVTLVITADGHHFIERTADGVRMAQNVDRVIKIEG